MRVDMSLRTMPENDIAMAGSKAYHRGMLLDAELMIDLNV